jgi:DNA processing protein
MMTARLAFSYDRDVFALPGRVDDARSQGCNMLIRSKIAEPLTSIPEFLDSLGMKAGHAMNTISDMEALSSRYRCKISDDKISLMSKLLGIIRLKRGITVEDLAIESGLEYARAVELTSTLEIDGFIHIDLLQRCCICPKKNR